MSRAIDDMKADRVDALVAKLQDAAEGYAKMNVLEEFGVPWQERREAVWALIRRGHYEAWHDPAVWEQLSSGDCLEAATAEDLVDFLARVEHVDDRAEKAIEEALVSSMPAEAQSPRTIERLSQLARLTSFWPMAVDRMAMQAYAREPDLVESRAGQFAPLVHKGMQLVRRRFGVISRDELADETIEDLAMMAVWRGLNGEVFDVVDGQLTELRLDHHGDPEAKQRFLSNFVDEDRWAQAVLDAVFEGEGELYFSRIPEAWRVADLKQLAWLIAKTRMSTEQWAQAWMLLEARSDAPAELFKVVLSLLKAKRYEQAEFAAVGAARAAVARGEAPPEGMHKIFFFKTLGLPQSRDEDENISWVIEALHAYDEELSVAHIASQLEESPANMRPFQVLKAYPDNEELLRKALEAVEAGAEELANTSLMLKNRVVFGLARLGPRALEPIAEAFAASAHSAARDTYRRTVIAILADAPEPQDPAFDRFVSLTDFEHEASATDRSIAQWVIKDYREALAKMPEARAVARVHEDLDGKPHWLRALAALEVVPHPDLLQQAFRLMSRKGLPPSSNHDWLGPVLTKLEREVRPFLGPALAASDSPDFHNAIRSQLGEQDYEKLLAAAGGKAAADESHAAKIRRLAQAAFESDPDAPSTVVYVFERRDGAPAEGTLSRIGGRPVGVTADSWPGQDDEGGVAMHHLLTLDLDEVPALSTPFGDDVRGLSLFVRAPQLANPWQPHAEGVEVVQIDRDNIDEYVGDLPVASPEARGFEVHEIEVPVVAFDLDSDGDVALRYVSDALYNAPAWGGSEGPIWLQGEAYEGDFVLQFDERFIDINLGDAGIMYVFADTAFMQCH